MTFHRKVAAVFAAGALALTFAACGDDSGANDPRSMQTASNGDVFSDTDIDFVTGMIPHHAQALAMVDIARGRALSPGLQQLMEDIQATQGPEIEQMVDWLTAWEEPIPETMRDHANAEDGGMTDHGAGDQGSDRPGMLTDDEMAALEDATGSEFEQMWLELMIEHHGGAVEMARDEQEHGVFAPAQQLARSIETSQRAEIDHMKELLAS